MPIYQTTIFLFVHHLYMETSTITTTTTTTTTTSCCRKHRHNCRQTHSNRYCIDKLPVTITRPGVYRFTRDLTYKLKRPTTYATAIYIQVPNGNVTLNLRGHKLTLAGLQASQAILANGVNHLTIRNGTIMAVEDINVGNMGGLILTGVNYLHLDQFLPSTISSIRVRSIPPTISP